MTNATDTTSQKPPYLWAAFVFLGTLALYEALIRRFNLLRFLFGMKRVGARRPGPASSSVPG